MRKPIKLHCLLCGNPTGTELKIGNIKIPKNEDVEGYLGGVCPECAKHLEDGGVFFTDADDRVIKVGLEASNSKISPEYRGKVIKLPRSAFEEVLRVYYQDQISKPGNGDGVMPPAEPRSAPPAE